MTTLPFPPRTVALRPLALPAEHGGWGFLFEPMLVGLLVAPSWSGAFVAAAALSGFLARHPLKLAFRDAVRGRRYPRTFWCRALAASYAIAALLSLSIAVAMSGANILVPFLLAMPFAALQAWLDAKSRGRELLAEVSGAVAMASIAAAIALAGGAGRALAYGLAGIMIARFVPAILYVRALLGRLPAWCVWTAHVAALGAVGVYARPLAIAAMVVLLIRAVWGLTHVPPRAKTIGWREIVFGIVTVALVAASV
ncbi:MAG TPA: YwiC-like family protein [Thermoanaerobaculia bacterium]|nr:YwiC-like family protein [Thermoanaerobaculia bacterium]